MFRTFRFWKPRFLSRSLSMLAGVALILSMLPAGPAAAESHEAPGITVKLDGKALSFEVAPQIVNGRTLVPLRAIFEALGARLDWDPATRTAKAVKGLRRVELPVDTPGARVGQRGVILDVAPQIVNGRTLVPLRFVSEALGAKVAYDAATRTVDITSVARVETPAQGGSLEAASLAFASYTWDKELAREDVQKVMDVLNDFVVPHVVGEFGAEPRTKFGVQIYATRKAFLDGLAADGISLDAYNQTGFARYAGYHVGKKRFHVLVPKDADWPAIVESMVDYYAGFLAWDAGLTREGKMAHWLLNGITRRAMIAAWAEFGQAGEADRIARRWRTDLRDAAAEKRLLGLAQVRNDNRSGTYDRAAHAYVAAEQLLKERGSGAFRSYFRNLASMRHEQAFATAFGESEDAFSARLNASLAEQATVKPPGMRIKLFLPKGVTSIAVGLVGTFDRWGSNVPGPGEYTLEIPPAGHVSTTANGFRWAKSTRSSRYTRTYVYIHYSEPIRVEEKFVDYDGYAFDSEQGEALWVYSFRYFTDFTWRGYHRGILESGVALRGVETIR